jgi:ketosteroid isomerase-like protein
MTRYLALLLAVAGSLFAADPADAVKEAAAGWRQAAIQQDKAALERLLSEDLIYTHGGGNTQNKAEYIAAVMTGPSHYESFTSSDTRIRVYGNIAVLSGYVDVKTPGRDSYRVRTLEIYSNNNGQWQFTAKESVRMGGGRRAEGGSRSSQ